MGNTRYPSGIKGKAALAWVGGAAIGVSPLFMFYYTYLVREHYVGNAPRHTYGEERVFHMWMITQFRHPVQMGEALRSHPQYKYSFTDKFRLRINELEHITRT
jgi:hypothetical protein